MGCGKSAWDDEIEHEIYQRKLDRVNCYSPAYLIRKLDQIKDVAEKVNKETTGGSRYLFHLLDELLKETNWEKWG